MKVPINKPEDVKSFLDSLKDITKHKKKASNLLFEEIEHDIMDKERFVLEQTEKLKEMNDSYLTMIDYAKVLKCVSVIIPRIQAGQDVQASMHGGLINSSEVGSIDYERQVSLNPDNDRNAPLL
jgi:hypothetical protein